MPVLESWTTFFDTTSIELLAFDLMVASDVFSMLEEARHAEDFTEVSAALGRLGARARATAERALLGPGIEGGLARTLVAILTELERLAALPRDPRPARRASVRLGRAAVLEVARAAQSLRDFWRASEVAAHAARFTEIAREDRGDMAHLLDLGRRALDGCRALAAAPAARRRDRSLRRLFA
ncbi:MAG TPA: hypothetical protein VFF73_28225 [Planctomycetota bacterium]|nr:hypothetical protein [Planctomycetota bacterium]